jgi:cobalt-zinc-cadmium efflux system outer membrane protein
MKVTTMVVGAACALTLGLLGTAARADTAPSCNERITRASVVPCAIEASLGARAEELGLVALDGRRRSAAVLLPSNPTLAITGGLPFDPSTTERTLLWSAVLSQEVEIAGQRGARLDVVAAEQRAQRSRLIIAQRQTAADALLAYFDAIASREDLKLAERLMSLATALRTIAAARAEVGMGSDLDARLAEAAAIRLANTRIDAEQRVASTSAALASMLGLNPLVAPPRIDGELAPLAVADLPAAALVETALARRADMAALAAERDAQAQRVRVFERLRVPNPTFSAYARRDWIGERVVGVGISLPLPLPSPVGRTYAGEIAEATASTQRAETQIEGTRRAIRLEVVKAFEVASARKRRLDLYTSDQIETTGRSLDAIAEELVAKRLPVREALVAQQVLIEMLSGYVEARRALCFATVELARVAGIEIERGAQ